MEHYYTPPENIFPQNLKISGEEAKHLARVLRKEKSNEILVTDGTGNLYKCKIESVNRNGITCSILDKQKNINEPALSLTVHLSLLKNPSRFEFAIEKLTELGVHEIQPIITERVISKVKEKTFRWQSIAISAMKQSQRCWLPKVNKPIEFNIAISSCKSGTRLIAHEKSSSSLDMERGKNSDSSASGGEVFLFVGPEGGFTDEEVDFAGENGFKLISIGPRKYRSETAAVACASLILLN